MRGPLPAFLLALLLSACAQTATLQGEAAKSSEAAAVGNKAPAVTAAFPALEAEAVLSKGFQAIFDFSLDLIEPSSFALEGMRGLGAIDPNLVALLEKDRFQVRLGAETVFSAPLPSSQDARAWARLAIEGVIAARSKSDPLRGTEAEAVYQAIFDAALTRFDLHSRYAGAEETKRLKALREGQGVDGAVLPATVGMALSDQLAMIQIVGFNSRTAEAFETKLKEAQMLYGRQWKGLILDLRGNPGGLLDQAVRSADLLLGPGRIVATRGRHPQSSHNHDATDGEFAQGVPIVVLVDGRTASGGEILAAALQDRGRAVVVGTTTFGKGLVQTVIDLPNGGEIDLSWSRFHAPSGYALQGLGVLPNICTSSGTAGRGLSGLVSGEASLANAFAQWRTVGTGNLAARRTLRAQCPAEDGASEAEEVARRLLADRALFTKALAPTGAVAGLKP
ncbi:MAG: hypothetical protein HQL45_16245 [Alphaproteobacteria bacterium]|nr:hypothetical protein [Alphaproteobacteria bacterium]